MHDSNSGPRADDLVQALAAAFLDLSPDEQQLVAAIYETLLRGKPAALTELAATTGWPVAELDQQLRSWPGAYLDGAGRLVGFMGVAPTEMNHRVDVEGATSWAWCAFDPLFILPLVGRTGRVTSRCPLTGQAVTLTVTPDRMTDLSPPEVTISFLLPDQPFDADVQATFCHYVLFFASPEAGQQWTAQHPGTFLMPAEEAGYVGRATAAANFAHLSR